MVLVIADIGINHNGDMNLAHELIRQAAINGADIAKFQAYDVEKLFGPQGEDPNPEINKKVRPMQFDKEQFAQLKKWCEEEGVEFMASVFDEERLEWMEDLGMKRHKIASRVSKLNPELADKIITTGKETFVSYGFGGDSLNQHPNVKPLWCVSKYPTEYSDLNLPDRFVGMLKDGEELPESDYWYGLSDHSLGIESALVAVGRGAKVVEKHFTLDKSAKGFDHICSITPDELRDLAKYCKLMEKVVDANKKGHLL